MDNENTKVKNTGSSALNDNGITCEYVVLDGQKHHVIAECWFLSKPALFEWCTKQAAGESGGLFSLSKNYKL